MANFNKVILAGNLTRDPELRYTPKGTAVARFGLALNRNYTTETGEKREEVTFVDVDAFGRQAEVISQYVKKGNPFLVEGRLKLDTWEDKNTRQKVSKLRVVLESFSFLGSGRTAEGSGAPAPAEPSSSSSAPAQPQRYSRPSAPAPAPAGPPPPPDDMPPMEGDDVPF